jgi:hypothetical protein
MKPTVPLGVLLEIFSGWPGAKKKSTRKKARTPAGAR